MPKEVWGRYDAPGWTGNGVAVPGQVALPSSFVATPRLAKRVPQSSNLPAWYASYHRLSLVFQLIKRVACACCAFMQVGPPAVQPDPIRADGMLFFKVISLPTCMKAHMQHAFSAETRG